MLASLVALVALSPALHQEALNTLSAEEKAEGFALLFDGKTADHWRAFKKTEMPKGWKIEDGALTFKPGEEGGDIITKEQYDDFDLRLEWKVAEGGNSGIMFRVSEEGRSTWETGPEMQVLDDAKHNDGKNPMTSAGSCYGLYACSTKTVKPAGEWNAVRIVVEGKNVQHWLNGVKVVEYELFSEDWEKRVAAAKFTNMPNYGRIPKGHIALQDHGDVVSYRNLRIRRL